jgi:nucleotide-binding universal stress UspA family protein
MADVILVVLDRPEAAAGLLAAAGCLARLTGSARIKVLAADPELRPVAESCASEAVQAALSLDVVDAAGRLTKAVEQRGRRADIVVVSKPLPDDSKQARETFRTALFQTERPVLVVPPAWGSAFGRRVAIAWRDDERAIKAVMPALRFLGHADAVHLMTGVRAGAAKPAIPPAVPSVLIEHGINADLHVLPIGAAPFGVTLLEAAQAVGADMLVMGAYAHGKLRDAILGGLTRHVLSHATLPAFMRH